MKKEDLDLNYGDKILVTYRHIGSRDDPRGVRFPEIQQDIGFFLELDGKGDLLHVGRSNPTLIGRLEDLPRLGEFGPPDSTQSEWNKRPLLLDETFYSLSEIIYIEKI